MVPDDREVEDRAGLVDVPVVGDPVVLEVEVPVVPVVEVQAVRDEAVDSTAEVREEDSIHPPETLTRSVEEITGVVVATLAREMAGRAVVIPTDVAGSQDAGLWTRTCKTGTRGWRWMTTWAVAGEEVPRRKRSPVRSLYRRRPSASSRSMK